VEGSKRQGRGKVERTTQLFSTTTGYRGSPRKKKKYPIAKYEANTNFYINGPAKQSGQSESPIRTSVQKQKRLRAFSMEGAALAGKFAMTRNTRFDGGGGKTLW